MGRGGLHNGRLTALPAIRLRARASATSSWWHNGDLPANHQRQIYSSVTATSKERLVVARAMSSAGNGYRLNDVLGQIDRVAVGDLHPFGPAG
jgi:hypothetical protein